MAEHTTPEAPKRKRKRRRRPSLRFEKRRWSLGETYIAGVDEVGRGCLAGPVVAAAVILPVGRRIRGLDDSKRLTLEQREKYAAKIQRTAVAVSVGMCTPEEIDEMNILWASVEAMRRAIIALDPAPESILVDGNRGIEDLMIPVEPIVGGDRLSQSIAAASVIAKTVRDRTMQALDRAFPGYGWDHNVGYPTPGHFEALLELGSTPVHRQSFRLRV